MGPDHGGKTSENINHGEYQAADPAEDEGLELEGITERTKVVPAAEEPGGDDGPAEREEPRLDHRDGLGEQPQHLRAEAEEQHAKRDLLVEPSPDREHQAAEDARWL